MLCCFFIKLPFKGLGATAGKVRAVAFDTVWGLARFRLCARPNEGGRNTKAKLAIKQDLILRFIEWVCCVLEQQEQHLSSAHCSSAFPK